MGFALVPKMLTLSDLAQHNGHYFTCLTDSFHYIKVAKVGHTLTVTEMYGNPKESSYRSI